MQAIFSVIYSVYISYYTIFLFLYLWGLCMLTFLDNCPVFVLQPLRGKTVSHCGEICNLWYAEELSLGPGTVLQIHYGSSVLLISPQATETCLFQHGIFLFVEMSYMKTNCSQTLVMLPSDQSWDQYCPESWSTAWTVEWSALKQMYGWSQTGRCGGGVESQRGCYSEVAQ